MEIAELVRLRYGPLLAQAERTLNVLDEWMDSTEQLLTKTGIIRSEAVVTVAALRELLDD